MSKFCRSHGTIDRPAAEYCPTCGEDLFVRIKAPGKPGPWRKAWGETSETLASGVEGVVVVGLMAISTLGFIGLFIWLAGRLDQ